jgi:hypothetical protein
VSEFEFKRARGYTKNSTYQGWNVWWKRPFPRAPEGYEVVYLGDAFKDLSGKWTSYHIPVAQMAVFNSRYEVALYLKDRKIANGLVCPECGRMATVVGVEYGYACAEHYDGVSEWRCEHCGTRWGRWTGNRLQDNEREPAFGKRVRGW